MDGDKERAKEVAEGSIQLAEKEISSDHLPENSRTAKENGDQEDGAEEKLVSEDGALKTNKEASEVKFVSADSQNGDAKIDIENVRVAFVGMGKEELMKFANDPFWVRLRWLLFVLFWLLWVAMLAGAIAIIIMAPKCAAPAPLKWWEQSPLYHVFLPTFKDGSDPQDGIGDLKGLNSKVDYINDLGIKGIALSSVLKVSSGGSEEAVEDFKNVDPQYGTLEDFKEFIATLKKKGIHLLLNLVPNHSSAKHEWFMKSEQNDPKYKDYYVWSSGKRNSSGDPEPPNKWLSLYGGSAWKWSSSRNEFYLHQFHPDEPDLNFSNSAVLNEFKEIFEFWLNLGVSGFQLNKVEYLLEDPDLKEEEKSSGHGAAFHDQYDYYSHTKTTNQKGIINILAEWKAAISNYSDGEGVLTVAGNLSSDLFVENETNAQVFDLLQKNTLFLHLKPDFTASDLNQLIETYLRIQPNKTRLTWQLSIPSSSRVASRFSPDYVDGLNMVAMLLPGTPTTLYGEELGMEDASLTQQNPGRCVMSWNNDTNAGFTNSINPQFPTSKNYEDANVEEELQSSTSSLAVYKELVVARNTPSIMHGDTEYATLNNGTVFAFTRVKSGNPGYLVALNTADTDLEVSFSSLKLVPEELNVQIISSNYNNPNASIKLKSKLGRENVYLSARSALVMTFVPKTN